MAEPRAAAVSRAPHSARGPPRPPPPPPPAAPHNVPPAQDSRAEQHRLYIEGLPPGIKPVRLRTALYDYVGCFVQLKGISGSHGGAVVTLARGVADGESPEVIAGMVTDALSKSLKPNGPRLRVTADPTGSLLKAAMRAERAKKNPPQPECNAPTAAGAAPAKAASADVPNTKAAPHAALTQLSDKTATVPKRERCGTLSAQSQLSNSPNTTTTTPSNKLPTTRRRIRESNSSPPNAPPAKRPRRAPSASPSIEKSQDGNLPDVHPAMATGEPGCNPFGKSSETPVNACDEAKQSEAKPDATKQATDAADIPSGPMKLNDSASTKKQGKQHESNSANRPDSHPIEIKGNDQHDAQPGCASTKLMPTQVTACKVGTVAPVIPDVSAGPTKTDKERSAAAAPPISETRPNPSPRGLERHTGRETRCSNWEERVRNGDRREAPSVDGETTLLSSREQDSTRPQSDSHSRHSSADLPRPRIKSSSPQPPPSRTWERENRNEQRGPLNQQRLQYPPEQTKGSSPGIREWEKERASKGQSAGRRSRSPRAWSPAPRRRQRFPNDRSGSPRRRSPSPHRQLPSPRRRSPLPHRQSPPPRRRSRSPRRQPSSPRRRSLSPRRQHSSQRRRSFSPPTRMRSPRRRSSPQRQRHQSPHDRTPTRAHSPSPHRGRRRTERDTYHSPKRTGGRYSRSPRRRDHDWPDSKNLRNRSVSRSPRRERPASRRSHGRYTDFHDGERRPTPAEPHDRLNQRVHSPSRWRPGRAKSAERDDAHRERRGQSAIYERQNGRREGYRDRHDSPGENRLASLGREDSPRRGPPKKYQSRPGSEVHGNGQYQYDRESRPSDSRRSQAVEEWFLETKATSRNFPNERPEIPSYVPCIRVDPGMVEVNRSFHELIEQVRPRRTYTLADGAIVLLFTELTDTFRARAFLERNGVYSDRYYPAPHHARRDRGQTRQNPESVLSPWRRRTPTKTYPSSRPSEQNGTQHGAEYERKELIETGHRSSEKLPTDASDGKPRHSPHSSEIKKHTEAKETSVPSQSHDVDRRRQHGHVSPRVPGSSIRQAHHDTERRVSAEEIVEGVPSSDPVNPARVQQTSRNGSQLTRVIPKRTSSAANLSKTGKSSSIIVSPVSEALTSDVGSKGLDAPADEQFEEMYQSMLNRTLSEVVSMYMKHEQAAAVKCVLHTMGDGRSAALPENPPSSKPLELKLDRHATIVKHGALDEYLNGSDSPLQRPARRKTIARSTPRESSVIVLDDIEDDGDSSAKTSPDSVKPRDKRSDTSRKNKEPEDVDVKAVAEHTGRKKAAAASVVDAVEPKRAPVAKGSLQVEKGRISRRKAKKSASTIFLKLRMKKHRNLLGDKSIPSLGLRSVAVVDQLNTGVKLKEKTDEHRKVETKANGIAKAKRHLKKRKRVTLEEEDEHSDGETRLDKATLAKQHVRGSPAVLDVDVPALVHSTTTDEQGASRRPKRPRKCKRDESVESDAEEEATLNAENGGTVVAAVVTDEGSVEEDAGCARSRIYKRGQVKKKAAPACWEAAGLGPEMTNSREARQELRRFRKGMRSITAKKNVLTKNALMQCKKAVYFRRSNIHGMGLFARENIEAGEFVIEYVGEVIRKDVADIREKVYRREGMGDSYLFRLNTEMVVDATRKGGIARFINHCCDPNVIARIMTIAGEEKILFYSKKAIRVNEELTYDYKFDFEEEDKKIPCLCGVSSCRKTLN